MAALAGVALAARARARSRLTEQLVLFIGTQGDQPGQGIFAARLDGRTGQLSPLGLQAEVARPTWLLADPRRALLFAVSELGNAGDREGEVLSFAIDGCRLQSVGRTSSGGGGATHLDLARDGGSLFVANFGGGQAAAIPVAPDGTLGAVQSHAVSFGMGPHRRQTAPHPHGVTLAPGGRFLLVPDMGADRVFVHRYDAATKTLSPATVPFAQLPAGSGPRLALFGRGGRYLYMLTELSAELFVFRWDAGNGTLQQIQSLALDPPGSVEATSAAALVMAASGRFLYASNRATGAIQVYAVSRRTGLLDHVQTVAAGGAKPWAAAISPDGRWLIVANQGSDTVTVFEVDAGDGTLTPMDISIIVPTPTSIAFPAP